MLRDNSFAVLLDSVPVSISDFLPKPGEEHLYMPGFVQIPLRLPRGKGAALDRQRNCARIDQKREREAVGRIKARRALQKKGA